MYNRLHKKRCWLATVLNFVFLFKTCPNISTLVAIFSHGKFYFSRFKTVNKDRHETQQRKQPIMTSQFCTHTTSAVKFYAVNLFTHLKLLLLLPQVFQTMKKYELAIGTADMSLEVDSTDRNVFPLHVRAKIYTSIYMRVSNVKPPDACSCISSVFLSSLAATTGAAGEASNRVVVVHSVMKFLIFKTLWLHVGSISVRFGCIFSPFWLPSVQHQAGISSWSIKATSLK